MSTSDNKHQDPSLQHQQLDLFNGMMATSAQFVQPNQIQQPQGQPQPQFPPGPHLQQIPTQIIQTANGPQLVPQGIHPSQMAPPLLHNGQPRSSEMISPNLTTAQQLSQRRHSTMMQVPVNPAMMSPHPLANSHGGSGAPTPRPSSQAQVVQSQPGSTSGKQHHQSLHPSPTPQIAQQQWAQIQTAVAASNNSMSAASASAMMAAAAASANPNPNGAALPSGIQQWQQIQQLQQLQATYGSIQNNLHKQREQERRASKGSIIQPTPTRLQAEIVPLSQHPSQHPSQHASHQGSPHTNPNQQYQKIVTGQPISKQQPLQSQQHSQSQPPSASHMPGSQQSRPHSNTQQQLQLQFQQNPYLGEDIKKSIANLAIVRLRELTEKLTCLQEPGSLGYWKRVVDEYFIETAATSLNLKHKTDRDSRSYNFSQSLLPRLLHIMCESGVCGMGITLELLKANVLNSGSTLIDISRVCLRNTYSDKSYTLLRGKCRVQFNKAMMIERFDLTLHYTSTGVDILTVEKILQQDGVIDSISNLRSRLQAYNGMSGFGFHENVMRVMQISDVMTCVEPLMYFQRNLNSDSPLVALEAFNKSTFDELKKLEQDNIKWQQQIQYRLYQQRQYWKSMNAAQQLQQQQQQAPQLGGTPIILGPPPPKHLAQQQHFQQQHSNGGSVPGSSGGQSPLMASKRSMKDELSIASSPTAPIDNSSPSTKSRPQSSQQNSGLTKSGLKKLDINASSVLNKRRKLAANNKANQRASANSSSSSNASSAPGSSTSITNGVTPGGSAGSGIPSAASSATDIRKKKGPPGNLAKGGRIEDPGLSPKTLEKEK